jgi:Uma2 family endonuclease
MNIQHPAHMDQAAFLAWVQGREERYELDRGRVIMMTGGSREHWRIGFNIARALDDRLDSSRYMVVPELGIDIAAGSIRFPDVVVDVPGETRGDLKARAPVLIVEVLSPSSERVDLGDKAAEYLKLPSLTSYLVFAQDEMKAWVWTRGPNDDFPPGPEVLEGQDAVARIEPLKIELPFAEIYDRVRF